MRAVLRKKDTTQNYFFRNTFPKRVFGHASGCIILKHF